MWYVVSIKKSSPAVHLEKVPHRTGNKVYYSWLLRTSYREGNKIRHKTLANVSDLPPEALEALRRSLKGERLVAAGEAMRIRSSRSHGAVHAVLAMIRKTGLDRDLLSYDQPWRRVALAMIASRILRPKSKLFTSRWWQNTTLPGELGLAGGGQNPNDLYGAMDEFLAHQEAIQEKLAKKHLKEGCLVLYWELELQCPLRTHFRGIACVLNRHVTTEAAGGRPMSPCSGSGVRLAG